MACHIVTDFRGSYPEGRHKAMFGESAIEPSAEVGEALKTGHRLREAEK
jgi:hypothetical protein